jgi:hypothetical protein
MRQMQQQLLLGPKYVLCNHHHQDGNKQDVNIDDSNDHNYNYHNHNHNHYKHYNHNHLQSR